MKNKKLYNYLPNLIISVFLAFLFLALSLLFAADNIFFEPTTYTNSMHKIKIEDTAFDEIQTYCEQQYAYTGVEADTLKNRLTKVMYQTLFIAMLKILSVIFLAKERTS